MLNRCEFIGHLGRDPESRTTQSGVKVVALSIGVSRKWKDGNGQQKEATEWIRANVWGSSKGDGLAGVAEKYLRRGSKLYIAGRMETRKWQDQSGQDRYSTEIMVSELELLDSRDGGSGDGVRKDATTAPRDDGGWSSDDFGDEVPF